MGRDGICRVQGKTYSKCIRFYDINYQLAQNEDKNAIFENWCDFLNYFDASIHFQLSFINHKSSMKEFEQVIRIRPQEDAFDDVRMEYAKMLKQQLAKGNNGLVKSKYITFSIEADNIREAKPKLVVDVIKADTLRIRFSLYPADSILSHFLISDRLLDGQFFLPAFLFLLFFFLFLFSVYFFVPGICDSFLIFLFSQPFFLLSVFLYPETA